MSLEPNKTEIDWAMGSVGEISSDLALEYKFGISSLSTRHANLGRKKLFLFEKLIAEPN